MDEKEYSKYERAYLVVANWVVFISAPVWAPFHFWRYAISGKQFLDRMLRGKGKITD